MVGATLGKRPFAGKSQISLASSILEADPEPVSKLKPGTPPAFEHVVTTCLQKNPEERYQTAHDTKGIEIRQAQRKTVIDNSETASVFQIDL